MTLTESLDVLIADPDKFFYSYTNFSSDVVIALARVALAADKWDRDPDDGKAWGAVTDALRDLAAALGAET